MKGNGIVIIALGHPQYGNMAANLASSIRYMDKEIGIHLVHSGNSISHLTEAHKRLFTSIAESPPEHYTKNGKTVYLKAKTCIYELSPFEKTLMLDADMIWFSNGRDFRKAGDIFEELKDVPLTFQNRGYFDLNQDEVNEKFSFWCNIREVKEKYLGGQPAEALAQAGKGRFYSLHSEFVYFNRSSENQQFFDLAREVFDNPLVKPADFDGDIPDELAFDIAVAVTGRNPHKEDFLPIHWYAASGAFDSQKDREKYYGMSIGGNRLPPSVLDKYRGFARFYAKALGLPYHFNVYPKKKWSVNRKNM